MSKIAPRFGVHGDVTMYAGEPFPIVVQLRPTIDDDPVDLTGRSFAMIAYVGATGETLADVAAEADGDSVPLAFTAAETLALFEAAGDGSGRLMVAELVGGGLKPLGDGALLLCRSPAAPEVAPAEAPTAPYIGITYVQAANRVQYVERGAPATIALGTVTQGALGADPVVAMRGPAWARIVDFTIPGTDMDAIGYPDGAVPHYAMRLALADAGVLFDVATNIDADIASAVNIRWSSGAPIKPGDALADFIQATLGYSDPEMSDLFTAAAAAV